MDSEIEAHCAELNRCNQRGGRMLSILDLIDAQTLDLDLAALLMVQMRQGASFMVGARPGGAGKTTVMCALINLIPPEIRLVAATSQIARSASESGASARRCFICHEIGAGPYFAYLWGKELRTYCALSEEGHMLATNLHADDLDETHAQVCRENGVPEAHFNAFRCLIYLRVRGAYPNAHRMVESVYLSDGKHPHQRVFDRRQGLATPPSTRQRQCHEWLAEQIKTGGRTIEQTRTDVIGFYHSLHAANS